MLRDLSPLMRITRGVCERHVVLALLALLAGANRARAESLAELLQAVAANARFASPARADVRIACGEGCKATGTPAIFRTLYYRDLINNLGKTRRDAVFARVGASWRPGEITVESVRQATKTHLTLSWREAPEVPDALFEPAGLGQPSRLGWP